LKIVAFLQDLVESVLVFIDSSIIFLELFLILLLGS